MRRMKILKTLRLEAGLSLREAGEPRFSAESVRVYEQEKAQLMQLRYLAQLRKRCRISWSELGKRIDAELKEEKEENETTNTGS